MRRAVNKGFSRFDRTASNILLENPQAPRRGKKFNLSRLHIHAGTLNFFCSWHVKFLQ